MAIVNLDDGTRVTLVPESKVTVPKNFGPNLRAVRIDGAARFTVRPGGSERFQVRARDVAVEATGTDFVVRLLTADSSVSAVVTDGSILVRAGDSSRAVAKGGGVVVGKDGSMRAATPAEIEESTSWTNGQLTLANRPLRDVLPELKRWYGLDLKVPDLTLLDRPVTVRASLDSPMEAIKALEQSGNLKFGYEGETMVLRAAAR
jgi:transmembrane sensor